MWLKDHSYFCNYKNNNNYYIIYLLIYLTQFQGRAYCHQVHYYCYIPIYFFISQIAFYNHIFYYYCILNTIEIILNPLSKPDLFLGFQYILFRWMWIFNKTVLLSLFGSILLSDLLLSGRTQVMVFSLYSLLQSAIASPALCPNFLLSTRL